MGEDGMDQQGRGDGRQNEESYKKKKGKLMRVRVMCLVGGGRMDGARVRWDNGVRTMKVSGPYLEVPLQEATCLLSGEQKVSDPGWRRAREG